MTLAQVMLKQPYHWVVPPLPPLHSVLQNQGKTKVLLVYLLQMTVRRFKLPIHTVLKVTISGGQTILWFESNYVLFPCSPKSKSFNNDVFWLRYVEVLSFASISKLLWMCLSVRPSEWVSVCLSAKTQIRWTDDF